MQLLAQPQPDITCRDSPKSRHVCTRRPNCSESSVRQACPQSCGLCSPLVVPVHVATLVDGRLPIPAEAGRVLLEIGSSDRDTLDVDLLPTMPDAFLVTFEPLVDKYARALGRREDAARAVDGYEPLGQHHARGIVLPIAVAPDVAAPESGALNASVPGSARNFNVGRRAGCSSLLAVARGRRGNTFGHWCNDMPEVRRVWSVRLETVLAWVGRPVDFLKVDAQGMDLEVVRSGGPLLHRVRRVALEVVCDDCSELYASQPRCSEVLRQMERFGFVPVAPTPCSPSFQRVRSNSACELEVLFVRASPRRVADDLATGREGRHGRPRPHVPASEHSAEQAARVARHAEFLKFHKLHLNGCTGRPYSAAEAAATLRRPPSGAAVASAGYVRFGARPGPRQFAPYFVGSNTTNWGGRPEEHSHGMFYRCPRLCSLPLSSKDERQAELEAVRAGRPGPHSPHPVPGACPWY